MTTSRASNRRDSPRVPDRLTAGSPEPPAFLGTWHWREPAPGETLRAWTARTDRQMDELIARSLPWRKIGQTVRLVHAPHLGSAFDGRRGTITALGGKTFPDYVFVRLHPADGERDAPLMIGLESLKPRT